MLCRYETTLQATCPVDGSDDHYVVIIESPHEVRIERILEVTSVFTGERMTQEALTAAIAGRLLGCRIVTVGHHSGVKTTVTV